MEKRKKLQESGTTTPANEIALPDLTPEAERFLRMLQVHNQKTEKIRKTYTDYCNLRI